MYKVKETAIIYGTLLLLTVTFCPAFAQEALPTKVAAPVDNPTTPQKVELGKQLYFDPRLSRSGTISCNSCHNVMAGGDDNRAVSVGFKGQLGGRSSPTVWNAAFKSVQFWDGRASTLEEQAKGPIINPVEMGMENHNVTISRIKDIPGYRIQFQKVFGKGDTMNIDNVTKAIAAYERTLITPNSRYDQYAKGKKTALTKIEIAGYESFVKTGCVVCHSGANFSGPALPVGTGFFQKFPMFEDPLLEKKYQFKKDSGRAEVTKAEGDRHMFVVPTLRNIALTAPYFHNGKVQTLEEAVKIMAKLQISKDLSASEIESIVAFLKTLTGEFPVQTLPRLPETPGRTLITE